MADVSVTRTFTVGPVYKCTVSMSKSGMKAKWEPTVPTTKTWNADLNKEYSKKRDEVIAQYAELNNQKVMVVG
jgi:hypothetical protein